MDDPSQSITAIKATFIRAQVRHLSAPLEASTAWREFAPEPERRLSDKTIQDLVSRVNDKIKQHNRMVYSQQSQRHVAEQIETLHWNLLSTESEGAEEPAMDAVVVTKDTDLTDTDAIDNLPEEYDDLHLHPDYEGDVADAETYTGLREQLSEQSRRRDALKEKVARYQYLQKMLEPLADAQTNVQPNLVTRDGELSRELDRMRILLARVTGRVAEMHNNGSWDDNATASSRPQTEHTQKQKLELLLEMA